MANCPVVIAILGPTASGKSILALEVAERFGGEILNCDSLQMYRGFDIGSAKLSMEERKGIPHHFLDILEPDEPFTAGEYMRQGRGKLAEITARGRIPLVVGGTGFYLRALLEGLFVGPQREPSLRRRLQQREEAKGVGYLHRLLERLDPASARAIHPHDRPKLIRALEVCLLTRQRLSELHRQGRAELTGYRILKIGLNPRRAILYDRINQRTKAMFERGLIAEVESILGRGYASDLPPLRAHGYRQAVDYLQGRLSMDEALYHAQTNTRHYAKRQITWFRKEPGVEWFSGCGDDPQIQDQIFRYVGPVLDASFGSSAA